MKAWVYCALLLLVGTYSYVRAEHRDLILQAMCASKCNKGGKECREKCFKEPLEKAGYCGNSSNPVLNSCLDECNNDKNCASLDKCCSHKCGKTCQPPTQLDTIPGLPSIPENVTLHPFSDLRNVMIDWKHPGNCQYIIEIREENGLWMPAHKVPRISHPLKMPVRPGIQYAARVAAVNQNGTRGFSEPSKPIIVHLESRPLEAPTDLHFRGTLKNGSVSGLLSWQPVHSDQFVSKYTIQWSQKFFVEEAPPHKGRVEVHKKSVPHEKHCVRIKNLHPNSNYTFHVQAQMIFGREKITSKKATLNIPTSSFSSISKRGAKSKPKHFHVYHKVMRTSDGIINVKISWPVRERSKYAISWESECDSKTFSVVTGSHYTIPDVKKNCQYQVLIREKSECKKRRKLGRLSFKVT